MEPITLHQIFRYILKDDEILSTVINNKTEKSLKKTKKNKITMMSSMIIEYVPLAPHEIQQYTLFPQAIKKFLTPDHVRYGIKNIIEKNMVNINVSFLSSLNILLRPDMYKLSTEDQIKNLFYLEDFIKHRIDRNYQIDRVVKNTKRIQNINRDLIYNMTEGKIKQEFIQAVVNIFEINLLVFDFVTYDISLYWTHGSKYPFFNTFKDIFCMAYVQGNYEPIFTKNNTISSHNVNLTYARILTEPSIKCMEEIKLAPYTLIEVDRWNISPSYFVKIIEKYYQPETIQTT